MDVIGPLIAYCCWLHVHIVQPHGIVFEIRVADGYGACWSEDGCKVYAQYCIYAHNVYLTKQVTEYAEVLLLP